MEPGGEPRLRVYVGAAPGVGKTFAMLREAHALKARGLDVVGGFVETHGRPDTVAQVRDLELIPLRTIDYHGTRIEDTDIDAIIRRRPDVCVLDELAHTNAPGARREKRYQDVLDILDARIDVMTAINVQHLETLNDTVGRLTGQPVRETVPDTILDRADEIIHVDVTGDDLRERMRLGKIYKPDKVDQALSNFFRKGNLLALRELALRTVADKVGGQASIERGDDGDGPPAQLPERVMVCMSSNALAPRVIRTGARIASRLAAPWYAVHVETARERSHRAPAAEARHLEQNIQLAERLGALVVRVQAERAEEGLIAFARHEGITQVIFGQTARSRWELIWKGSTLDTFLHTVRDAAVQVVPLYESAR
jgi:two-component system sensor histidine kinase KdpD